MFVAEGEKNDMPIYFGFQKVTPELNIRTYVYLTDLFINPRYSIINYLCVRSGDDTFPELQKGFRFDEKKDYENFMQFLKKNEFYKYENRKRLTSITDGSGHVYGKRGGYIAYISKRPITKPLSFKALKL